MAKTKETAAPKLKCSICQAEVTAETYAGHIQSAHPNPQPPAAPAMPAQAWPQQQPWNNQQQQGPVPIAGPINGKDLAGGKYLKGEDVPDGTSEVRFRIVQFVRDPQGRSKLAAQVAEIRNNAGVAFAPEKVLFGFNTTNIRAVVGLGYNDMQQIVGKTVVCMMGMAPNPQKGGIPTKALFVARIEA